MSNDTEDPEDLRDLIPNVKEVRDMMEQDILLQEDTDRKTAALQLRRVGGKIRDVRKFPLRYSGNLNDIALETLSAAGWEVKSVLGPEELHGPTWDIDAKKDQSVRLRI